MTFYVHMGYMCGAICGSCMRARGMYACVYFMCVVCVPV